VCLAVPGRVIDIDRNTALPTGVVDFGGTRRAVCLAYVPDVGLGDYVVVHVGFAISVVDEAEAQRTWALLEDMVAADEMPGGEPGGSAS
jgi:hydrogenase expression/formation protein HypC